MNEATQITARQCPFQTIHLLNATQWSVVIHTRLGHYIWALYLGTEGGNSEICK